MDPKRNTRHIIDVDPGPPDLCVVAAVDKFTQTTEIPWRKKEVMEAQRVPKKLDPKRNIPKHIIIMLPRLKIRRES